MVLIISDALGPSKITDYFQILVQSSKAVKYNKIWMVII